MGVHPDGQGISWEDIEAIDVDQPHGLDQLAITHLAKAVRKRSDKEHVAFGDTTAGGEHKPGGCAVIGMDITDDCTAGVAADGTYVGKGVVWALSDASNWGVLFCATGDGTAPIGDWTVMRIHPDHQWGGGDITWTGAHEFDGSVDISGNVTIEGDLTLEGKLLLDSSADFSDVFIEGDASIAGTLKVATDFSLTGDMAVDGTANFGGNVKFAGTVDMSGEVAGDQIIKNWVNFVGNTPPVIKDSHGVNTVNRTAQGVYEISWTTSYDNTIYCVVGIAKATGGDAFLRIDDMTNSGVDIAVTDHVGNEQDATIVCVMAIGNKS